MARLVISFLFLNLFTSVWAQTISIPDVELRTCILNDTLINTNRDTVLDMSEAQNAKSLICKQSDVNDLTGIDNFTGLQTIDLRVNNVHSVDLNFAPNLEYVTLVDISDDDSVGLEDVQIHDLDSLIVLAIIFSNLKSIDVTHASNLEFLSIRESQLQGALDLRGNPNLQKLACIDGNITSVLFDPADNFILDNILMNNQKLGSIDLSNLKGLVYAFMNNNELKQLDVSENAKLERLQVNNNELAELDFSSNENITEFFVIPM